VFLQREEDGDDENGEEKIILPLSPLSRETLTHAHTHTQKQQLHNIAKHKTKSPAQNKTKTNEVH